MAITDGMRERIAAMARELAAEWGEVDESDALSWLDAIESRAVEIGDALHAALGWLNRRAPSAATRAAMKGRVSGS